MNCPTNCGASLDAQGRCVQCSYGWGVVEERDSLPVKTVHVGQEVFEVVSDPDDPDYGLRTGID